MNKKDYFKKLLQLNHEFNKQNKDNKEVREILSHLIVKAYSVLDNEKFTYQDYITLFNSCFQYGLTSREVLNKSNPSLFKELSQ